MRVIVLLSVLALGLVGCGDDAGDDEGGSASGNAEVEQARDTYARIVLASYKDSLEAAVALDETIDAFLDDPSERRLQDAREAWRQAREPYLQTEVYRFYDGPIDNPDDGPEGLINAWPLDEHYIDYVDDSPDAGIINDREQALDADALVGLNEQDGEKNIATGFHAVEFLLWGQDLSEDGPGDRPHTDFIDDATADNQDRRRRYLATTSDLLVEHLELLVDAWQEDEDNYRAEFEDADPVEGLRRILTGMIVLSGFETGGERLQAALDTGDQEDEHSCFSDNTHRDMVQDVRGIRNVYEGVYERTDGDEVEGPSVYDAVAALDEELAEAVRERIDKSLELAEALEPPFDNEISLDNPEGRERVEALVDSLLTQEGDLEDVFEAFELTPQIPEA